MARAGFDPNHPAALGMSPGWGFSAVAANGGFVNLLKAQSGTLVGSVTNSVHSVIGPAPIFDGSTSEYDFPGNKAVVDNEVTMAGIFVLTADNAFTEQYFVASASSGGGNTGYAFGVRTNSAIRQISITCLGQGNMHSDVLPITLGVPYFAAVSYKAGSTQITYVLKNLQTGAVLSFDSTLAFSLTPSTAGNGTYYIGQYENIFWTGPIAAVMWAPKRTSLAVLLKWSERPWDFWYPPVTETVIASISQTTTVTGITVTVDFGAPGEFLHALSSDLAAQLESTANLTAVTANGPVQLEFVMGVRGDLAAQLEYSGAVRSDVTAQLETTTAFTWNSVASTEILAGVRTDQIALPEVLAGVAGQSPAQLEITSSFLWNATGSLEFINLIRWDALSSLEVLAGVSGNFAGPLENLAGAVANFTVSIEDVAAFRSDSAAQAEIMTGVIIAANSSMQLEFGGVAASTTYSHYFLNISVGRLTS